MQLCRECAAHLIVVVSLRKKFGGLRDVLGVSCQLAVTCVSALGALALSVALLRKEEQRGRGLLWLVRAAVRSADTRANLKPWGDYKRRPSGSWTMIVQYGTLWTAGFLASFINVSHFTGNEFQRQKADTVGPFVACLAINLEQGCGPFFVTFGG